MSRLMTFMRLDQAAWSRVEGERIVAQMTLVVGAFAVMAWNRFGLLAFTAPRAPMRMILIGFYSWAALTVAVWLAARRADGGHPALSEVGAALGRAHLPLLLLGFFIAAVAGIAQVFGPGLVAAVLVFAIWMPALLVVAVRHATQLEGRAAFIAALLPYAVWLAFTGRYLEEQVGHLL